MSVIAGDVDEITFNHPEIGSGTIFPKAAEDSTFDPGGFRTDDDANGIDGSGSMIRKMNRNRWSFSGVIAWDMNVREDLDKIKKLAGHPVEATWTITHHNGTVWGGKGAPVGDVAGNGNAGTFQLKLAGGQELTKIVG